MKNPLGKIKWLLEEFIHIKGYYSESVPAFMSTKSWQIVINGIVKCFLYQQGGEWNYQTK
jgi:hypothetical protein